MSLRKAGSEDRGEAAESLEPCRNATARRWLALALLGCASAGRAAEPSPEAGSAVRTPTQSEAPGGATAEPGPAPETDPASSGAADQPGAAGADAADDSALQHEFQSLEQMAIEDLLNLQVTTATKTAQSARDAPANVTVITAHQIERAGCRSVAEALAQVPGLVVNTDHAAHNVGVRGIAGGLRGGSRHIKVLINGQPAAFRSDAQNLLGPEFIPISAIAQIEVIRGPASALYGLNAFLGVINVITKTGRDAAASSAFRGAVGSAGHGYSAAAEVALGQHSDKVSFFVAAASAREDRSRLRLPRSSPDLADYAGNDTSADDIARPQSFFGQLVYRTEGGGELHGQLLWQELNARSEYADEGAMSHTTNVNLRNLTGRLDYSLDLDPLLLRAFAAIGRGTPGPDDVVLPLVRGKTVGQVVERDFGFTAFTVGAEPELRLSDSSMTVGVELDVDREDLRQNIFVSRGTGQHLGGRHLGVEDFTNVGLYAQGLFGELTDVDLSGNVRYDVSNRFGNNFNYRAAAVWSMTERTWFKLLSGSSYRAPSPEQLYGLPVRPGGVQGALVGSEPKPLAPQTALTHEALLGYERGSMLLAMAVYFTTVRNRIEYVRKEGNLQPANLADSTTIGSEASVAVATRRALQVADLELRLTGACLHTSFAVKEGLTPREQELLTLSELYPEWTATAALNADVPRLSVNVNAQVIIYGRRLQSQTNQSIGRPFADDPYRHIRPSYPLDIVISSHPLRLLGERSSRLQVALFDLLGTASPEPGFNGINAPPLGRRLYVALIQEL